MISFYEFLKRNIIKESSKIVDPKTQNPGDGQFHEPSLQRLSGKKIPRGMTVVKPKKIVSRDEPISPVKKSYDLSFKRRIKIGDGVFVVINKYNDIHEERPGILELVLKLEFEFEEINYEELRHKKYLNNKLLPALSQVIKSNILNIFEKSNFPKFSVFINTSIESESPEPWKTDAVKPLVQELSKVLTQIKRNIGNLLQTNDVVFVGEDGEVNYFMNADLYHKQNDQDWRPKEAVPEDYYSL